MRLDASRRPGEGVPGKGLDGEVNDSLADVGILVFMACLGYAQSNGG